jgi:hypothetical protein
VHAVLFRYSWLVVVTVGLTLGACSGGSDAADWCSVSDRIEDARGPFGNVTGVAPAEGRVALDAFQDVMVEAVDSAPDEVRSDVESVVFSVGALDRLLDGVDFQVANLSEQDVNAFIAIAQGLDDPIERIRNFGERECGDSADAQI